LKGIAFFVALALPGSALAACSSSDGNPAKGTGGSGAEETGGSGTGASSAKGGASASGGAPSGGSSSGGAGTGGNSTMTMDGGLPTSCKDDTTGLPATVTCITHIDGRAIDADGKPIAAKTGVSACGPTQCNGGSTGPDGKFQIPVGLHLVPSVYSAQVHVRVDKAAFYYALPKDTKGPVVDVGDLRVLDMPAMGPALNVDRMGTPAQSVTSGDVTLEVPADVYVRLDVESNLAGAHGKEFRALTIPDKFLGEFADASLGVKAMYALEPFESSYEYPKMNSMTANVRLSFANTAKLPNGSAVDVLALGTYIYPDWIPPAAFAKVASAHVSSDGSKIDFDSGQGIPYLTWIALRPAK